MNSFTILNVIALLLSIFLLVETLSYKRNHKLSRKIDRIRPKRQSSSRIRPAPQKIPYASLSTGSIPKRVRLSSSRTSSSRLSSGGSLSSTGVSSSDTSSKSSSPALPSSSSYGSYLGNSGTGLGASNPNGYSSYGGSQMQPRYGYGQQPSSRSGGMRIPFGRSTYPYNQGGYGYSNQFAGPPPNPFATASPYRMGYQQGSGMYRQSSGYPQTYGHPYMNSGYLNPVYAQQPMMGYGTPSYYADRGGFTPMGHPYYSSGVSTGTSIGSPYRDPSIPIPDPPSQSSYGGSYSESSSYLGPNSYGSTGGYGSSGSGTGSYSSVSPSRYPYSSSQYSDRYGSYGSDDSSYGSSTGGGYGQGLNNAGPSSSNSYAGDSGSDTGDSGSYGQQYTSSGTYDPGNSQYGTYPSQGRSDSSSGVSNSQYSNYASQGSSDSSSGLSSSSPYGRYPYSGQSYSGSYGSDYSQSSGTRYEESSSVGIGYGQDPARVASGTNSMGSNLGSYGGGYGSEDRKQGLAGSPKFTDPNSDSVSGVTGSEPQSYGYYDPRSDQSYPESSQPYQSGQFYSHPETQDQNSQIAFQPESGGSEGNQISQDDRQPISSSRSGENSGRDVTSVSSGRNIPILIQQRMRQIELDKLMRQKLMKPHPHPSMRKCEKDVNGLPDVYIDPEKLRASLHLDFISLDNLKCAKNESCLAKTAYGDNPQITRRLMKFATVAHNKGTAAFRPFLPREKWPYHSCHKHYHSSEEFAHYNLFNGTKMLAEGHKASFCLEDSGCTNPCTPIFNCTSGEQGISPGCYDTYLASRDCQWIDVTDVPYGDYILKVTVNPLMNGVRMVKELNYDNNVVECDISILVGEAEAHKCWLKSK